MRVTMREVAERAGVSVKTVSRVVNEEPHIRPETRAQVRAAIADLGWTPNASARTLRTGRTGVVGIAVAELRRPLLAAVVERLVMELDRHGLHAAVEPTHDDPARLASVMAQRGHAFDALLAVDAPALPAAAIAAADGPVVRVDVTRRPPAAGGADAVHADLDQAVALALRHMRVMGRHHAVRIGPGPLAEGEEDRGIARVDPGEVGRAAGYRAAQRALVDRPGVDALVCGTDEIALGALAGLHAAGVEVPGRVAVIGYGDLDDGRFSTPSLSTIDPDTVSLARGAVDLMTARLAGSDREPAAVAVPVTLVQRESTSAAGVR
ncbi:LacI family transcriptional regulator [Glycomyces sp. A-F 0318]|uniref:LacI family DNA-binding transcriptional regulator n=1 Tax=Glycomyces amatae TaxID=2881355 RepID=UPI001E34D7F2|nr:LacI family DNA-binding transcriptional regulator [Glycomyces amatae]MCD0447045.1 LacI family transcriptional regulator [Glycomyces amatae]